MGIIADHLKGWLREATHEKDPDTRWWEELNLVRITPKLSNSSYQTKDILVIPLADDHTNFPNRCIRRGKSLAGHIYNK